jgi:hypothetical protein
LGYLQFVLPKRSCRGTIGEVAVRKTLAQSLDKAKWKAQVLTEPVVKLH